MFYFGYKQQLIDMKIEEHELNSISLENYLFLFFNYVNGKNEEIINLSILEQKIPSSIIHIKKTYYNIEK
jgi:hypothetical protein